MRQSTYTAAIVTPFNSPSSLVPSVHPGFHYQLIFKTESSRWMYRFQQGIKWAIDIVLATLGLLMLLPLLALITLLVKITSPGPVLYKSLRVGKNGRSFHMLKFRTMGTNADSLRDQLREEANLQGELFKLKSDPRVTPFGKFLRATSLDELPQLINVIKGEMSLVGPRPLPPDESILFEEPYTIRFQVLPGITGQWQISGRSNLTFQQLCEIEMTYVLRWNFLNDLMILLKTIPSICLRKGAY